MGNLREQLNIEVTSNVNEAAKIIGSKLKNTAIDVSKAWNKMTTGIRSGFTTIAKGTAIAAPIGIAIKKAAEFEKGLAEIATLTNKDVSSIIKDFSSIVEQTQISFGKNQQDVIKGLYDGISAGVPLTKLAVKEYLDATGKLSVAGVTDFKVAGDAVTSLRNAFKASFTDISDALLVAVREGKTTLPELAGSIGQVSSIAQVAGVSMDQLLASVAAMTKTGGSTAEAVTKIKAAISNFIKPSKNAEKILNKYRITIDNTLLSHKGLSGAFDLIATQLKKNTKNQTQFNRALSEIFPNIRAFGAAASFTGATSDDLAKAIEAMGNKTGIANIQFEKINGTLSQRLNVGTQKLQISFKKLGESMIPVANKLSERLSVIVDNFNNWLSSNKENAKAISATVLGAGALVASFGALKIVSSITIGFFGLAKAIGLVKLATIGLGAVFAAINPAVWVIGVTAAVTAGITALVVYWEDVKNMFITGWNEVKKFFGFDVTTPEMKEAAYKKHHIKDYTSDERLSKMQTQTNTNSSVHIGNIEINTTGSPEQAKNIIFGAIDNAVNRKKLATDIGAGEFWMD